MELGVAHLQSCSVSMFFESKPDSTSIARVVMRN